MSITTGTQRRPLSARPMAYVVEAAARRLYDSEIALHDAHQARIAEWIDAASERLHAAVEAYLAAITPQAALPRH